MMALPQILCINAALILAMMFVLWLISLYVRDASIVDIFWGLGFVVVATTTFVLGPGGFRAGLLTTLTTIWGIRLSAYLAWRNVGKGEDKRYRTMRDFRGESFWWISLLTVFGLQGAVMWVVSLPVQVGQFETSPIGAFGYLGVALWSIGFLFEAIGDYQLARFKSSQTGGQVMDRGLWRYTRHPNYFGNALIWWGLFLLAVSPSTMWLIVSPALMTFLLLKVSGVALLERDLTSRSQQYRDYVQRTSPFLPWPPKGDETPRLG